MCSTRPAESAGLGFDNEKGGETTYDIHVVNQGSKAATNVRLLAILPQGLKALAAEGPTRNFIVDGLGALGITDHAIGVASAEDALAAAAEIPPDLVISDIRMTGLNGLDLARFLHQSHPNTKVILITGYSTRDIEKAAKVDCRKAYAGAGLLAVVPLAADALGKAGGCKW